MKLVEVIFLALSASFFGIAVHQTIYYGFFMSYWLYMLSAMLFFGFVIARRSTLKKQQQEQIKSELGQSLQKNMMDRTGSNKTAPKSKRKK